MMHTVSPTNSATLWESLQPYGVRNSCRRLRPALVVAALAYAQGATAAIITHTQDFPAASSTGLGWSAPITIPFFDTLNGTLNQISIKWEGTVTDSLFVQNFDFFQFNGTVGSRGGVGIVDGSFTTLGSGIFAQTSHAVSLGQFESTTVGGTASGTLSWVLNPGDTGFQPYGIIGATLYSSSMDGYATGSGIIGTMPIGFNSTEGRLTVTYDYSAVPEPTALYGMVVLLGLVGASTMRGRCKK